MKIIDERIEDLIGEAQRHCDEVARFRWHRKTDHLFQRYLETQLQNTVFFLESLQGLIEVESSVIDDKKD